MTAKEATARETLAALTLAILIEAGMMYSVILWWSSVDISNLLSQFLA